MNKVIKGFTTAAAGGLIVLLTAVPALAHPKVVSRTPEDGSTVDQPPSEVEVEFDEVVTNADLDVFDPCGAQVDNGNPQVLGTNVSVGMSGDKSGAYTVRWRVISEDGHNVSGDWTFTSSGGDACPGSGGGGDDNGGGGNEQGGTGGDGKDGSGGRGDTTSGGGGTGGSDPTVAAGGGNGGDPAKGDKQPGHKNHGKNTKGKKGHKHHQTKNDDPKEIDLVAGDDPEGSSDLPLDWLLISFGIAALIGAAAGTIYVSLTPPR